MTKTRRPRAPKIPWPSEKSLGTVVKLVEQVTGIVIPQRRWPMLQSTLQRLVGHATAGDAIERLLTADADTRRELISALSIAETYMFRHTGHFELLSRIARQLQLQGRGCRVLCAGCSTGEEVWSAAAVLTAVGTPPGSQANRQHQVIGWEINPKRISHARNGRYHAWSCRRGLLDYGTLFQQESKQIVVDPKLREIVDFEQVNLVSQELPDHHPMFDVIFFRNVAMYWRQDTINRVCTRLAGMVADDGAIFVGPTDPVELRGPQWRQQISNGVRTFWQQAETATSTVKAAVKATAVKATVTADPLLRQRGLKRWHLRSLHLRTGTRSQALQFPTAQPARQRWRAEPSRPVISKQYQSPLRDFKHVIMKVQSLADSGAYDSALALLQEHDAGRSLPGRLWQGILLLSLDSSQEAIRAFRQCVFLAPEEVEYRRWLAVAYEAAGRSREAARELRNVTRALG